MTTSSSRAVIASGASLSSAVSLVGFHLAGIAMPSAWTAASLTFQGSADGATFANLHDGAGEVTIAAAADRHIVFDHNLFRGMAAVKIRSGPAAIPVAQAAERALVAVLAADR
ncbi:MAG: hypothetical protein ACRD0D_00950 [Acidimicrobiales bacterium]